MLKTQILALGLGMTALLTPVQAQEAAPIFDFTHRLHPVVADNAMVATQEARATRVGVDILKAGGNAVDAAVAVGFALAVTLPRAGNLGGGGFMLVHDAKRKETLALDYREKAPLAAYKDMYLDENGDASPEKSRFSYLAVGVPGTVKGLLHAQARWGKLSRSEVMAPAIALAQQGIEVTHAMSHALSRAQKRLSASKATAAIFLKPDGSIPLPGDSLVQSDLARSLQAIAEKGDSAFYQGEIAGKLVKDMAANGGLITLEDLAQYQVVERKPVEGQYQGYRIAAMPPPSSGGIHLVQLLNVLSHFPLKVKGHNSADSIHILSQAMKYVYADRSEYLGDPDFVKVPQGQLTDAKYAEHIAGKINTRQDVSAEQIKPGDLSPYESTQTTHFSVADKWGNVVSNTYTLNFSFGTGIVAEGTGILLNNEMDDFVAKPGVPNAYGLLGGEANAVAPQKRPLSSMTPTIVFNADKPVLVTGSPGGSTIITIVLQNILNLLTYDMNLAEAVAAPRIHHQWLPDELRIEPGISPDTVGKLESMGHKISQTWTMGSVQAIHIRDGRFYGYSDPRRPGALSLGY